MKANKEIGNMMKVFGVSAAALLFTVGCGQQIFSVEPGSTEFGQQVQYSKDVDVLFVVDTSGSMAKHQEQMAAQVPVFIEGLNATGLDYQIAVTTMDMSGTGERGKLLAQTGTPAILNRSTPNLTNILAQRIRAGESGSPLERGREAALAAINGASSTGLLRENSLLNIIFLSNEEDDSSDAIDYVAALDQVRPKLPYGDRSWLVHFMGVLPNTTDCQTAGWGYSSPGLRYVSLAQASSGTSGSICDANFKNALTNVRARVLEVTTEYFLDREPIVKTIKVKVDGIEVPNNEVNGWTYYPPAKSIRFHGTQIPKAGARIKVSFDPEGLK